MGSCLLLLDALRAARLGWVPLLLLCRYTSESPEMFFLVYVDCHSHFHFHMQALTSCGVWKSETNRAPSVFDLQSSRPLTCNLLNTASIPND